MSEYSFDYRAGVLAGTLMAYYAVCAQAAEADGAAREAWVEAAQLLGHAVELQEKADPAAAEFVKRSIRPPERLQ